ncbi:hypothetical protein CBS101457_003060 [Exobasidium rhododendri]|nr:hypothetical protein CBS101457_003060 [Exobasidium rhododendri]
MTTASQESTILLHAEKSGIDQEQGYSPDERLWRPVFTPGAAGTNGPLPSEMLRAVTPGKLGLSRADVNMLRDNFSLTTWLLIGACLEGIALMLLPISQAILPPALLLAWRIVSVFLQMAGLRSNPHMKNVIMGKFSRHEPDEQGLLQGEPAQKPVVVLLLGARSNHPLGMFAPGYKELGDSLRTMVVELENNADKYGFRGSTPWISNGGDRSTAQELMDVFYFDSIDGLHQFAHSPAHRKGWDWWSANVASFDHLSIMHEIYEARPDAHESIYVNYHRSGRTGNNVQSPDGKWVAPLVDASEGQYRTSKGRLNQVDHGRGNDRYGGFTYQKANLFCPALSRA